MEFKVRALDGGEPKSVQEVEEQLLEKHEEELNRDYEPEVADNTIEDTTSVEEIQNETPTEKELREEDVLSYIEKRYNKQINSFDELLAERKESEDLPGDVAAYLKYKKETGRGFEDFIKLNKDYDSVDADSLLSEYLSATQIGLDAEDIDALMDEYRYDEDYDDEATIKKVKIARKKAIAEAKKFFNEQKEQYKIPLESSTGFVPDEDRELFNSYKQYLQEAKTVEEENNRKRQWFDQKTEELFNNEFKGFEFDVNNKKITFAPGDATELKKLQSTPANFINKFLDESGLIKDAAGYHKALSIAMNPDRFAKFFYEQGMSDATDTTMKQIKNISMSDQKVSEAGTPNNGFQVKAVNPDSGRKLKIRSIKKV